MGLTGNPQPSFGWTWLSHRAHALRSLALPCLIAWLAAVAVADVAHAGDRLDPPPMPSVALAWSTYLGGRVPAPPHPAGSNAVRNALDSAYDVDVDNLGNVYVTGQANSSDFPTTGGPPHAGSSDIFIAKFGPDGTLRWSRLLGGPNHDLALGVEVRSDGQELAICGWAGPQFPTQPCAACGGQVFQATFRGDPHPDKAYGPLDGVVGKLDTEGNVLWLSYFGDENGDMLRDCDIDPDGNVYVAHSGTGRLKLGTAGAYRETPYGGGRSDLLIAKLAADGRAIQWATYLGGSGADHGPSIRVHDDRSVYVATSTDSKDWPLVNPVDRTLDGGRDFAIARISPDGTALLFSSFLGGNGAREFTGSHDLAVDPHGNLYLCAATDSTDFPGVEGHYQAAYGGGVSDGVVAKVKVTPPTSVLAATYIGGRDRDGTLSGCALDDRGNVLMASGPASTNFPTTPGAFQRAHAGVTDATVVLLAADFSRLLYATYLGGAAEDGGRSAATDGHRLIIVGRTASTNFPVRAPYQARPAESSPAAPDAFVSAFSLAPVLPPQ